MVDDVFISYKRERRRAAEHLAKTLACYGYSVWFDYNLIKSRDFGRQIDAKIREAKATIVLWCALSVASDWVHEEVDLAHDLGTLVPVKIEACDLLVGNRRRDYVDLIGWDGAPRAAALDPLLDAVETTVGRPAALDRRALVDYEATWRRFGAPSLRAFALERVEEPAEGPRGLPERARPSPL